MSLVLVALLYPFGAFLMSLKRIKNIEFYFVFIILAIMAGLTIKIEADDLFNGDFTRYIGRIESYQAMTWADVFSGADYVIIIITKLLLLISANTRFIAVSYYVIFTIFLSFSLRIVFTNARISNNLKFYFYILTVLIVIPLTFLNALRFALATVFYIWCLLEIMINKKKIYYGIIFITPLIHFSYWGFTLLPFLYLLLHNKIRIVWLVFILSVVLNATELTSYRINALSEKVFSEETSDLVYLYASEEGLSQMNEHYNSLASESNINRAISEASGNVRNYGIMWLLFLLSVSNYRLLKKNKKLESTISLLLLAFSLANILSSASNGNRFFITSVALSIYVLYTLMQEKENLNFEIHEFLLKNKIIINTIFLSTLVNGLLTLYMGRKGFNFIHVLAGNPFTLNLC